MNKNQIVKIIKLKMQIAELGTRNLDTTMYR